tara:strand:+ start:2224 stop:4698 length:2475 start_codon:yes stop_codon:yes gene_type:complete
MAEIKQPNLDWFATLPKMQQEFLHESYPTDELKQGWFDLGKPFAYEGPYNYPMEIDPMTGIGPNNIIEMVNFEINPKFGVLGDFWMERNRPLKEFREDPNPASYTALAEFPYYMKTLPGYFNPATAPFVAGWDIIEGMHDFNPAQVALSALGVSKISKPLQILLAVGGIAGVPFEAEAMTISKALEYMKGLPLMAKGKPLTFTANQLLKKLESDVNIPGGVGPRQWRAIRENLEEIKYPMDKVQNSKTVMDDIINNNWTDDIDSKIIPNPHGDGKMDITKYAPSAKVVDTVDGVPRNINRESVTLNEKTVHNSKTVNEDANIHQGTGDAKGVISYTIFDIRGPNYNIIEMQNDAQAAIARTGAKATEKNDKYIESTSELWNIMYKEKMAKKGVSGVPSHVDLITQATSKEKFYAIVNHPLFDEKGFSKWKLKNPKKWKFIEEEFENNGFMMSNKMLKIFNETDAFGNILSETQFPGYQIFVKTMRELNPGVGFDEANRVKIREAPYETPLNNPNNPKPWVQEELSKVLDKSANNPNIQRIVLPEVEEVVGRWAAAGESTSSMLRSLYNKTIPAVLKKMGIEIQQNTKFRYQRKSRDDPFNNLIDAYVNDIPLIEGETVRRIEGPFSRTMIRYRDGVPGGQIALANGADSYVFRKFGLVVHPDADAFRAITFKLEDIQKAKSKGLASEFINELEEFGTEIVRLKPELEKSIDIVVDVYRQADRIATKSATKTKFFTDLETRLGQKLATAEEPFLQFAQQGFDNALSGYSDAFSLSISKLFKNLSPGKKEILEKTGVTEKIFDNKRTIEMTPELRDKIVNEGVYRN